jgi:hypothetical protein
MEVYGGFEPEYRLRIWPRHLTQPVSLLNLTAAQQPVNPG